MLITLIYLTLIAICLALIGVHYWRERPRATVRQITHEVPLLLPSPDERETYYAALQARALTRGYLILKGSSTRGTYDLALNPAKRQGGRAILECTTLDAIAQFLEAAPEHKSSKENDHAEIRTPARNHHGQERLH